MSHHDTLQYLTRESNPVLRFRRPPCRPSHSQGIKTKSRRRDSHPHDPVYRTGAFLFRATSAFQKWQCHSNGARIRTPCDSFGGCLLSQEHTAVAKRKAWDSNPHSLSGTRISSAVRPTISGYLPFFSSGPPENRTPISWLQVRRPAIGRTARVVDFD